MELSGTLALLTLLHRVLRGVELPTNCEKKQSRSQDKKEAAL